MAVKNIFFGNSKRDINMCGTIASQSLTAPYYSFTTAPVLTNYTESLTLTSSVTNNTKYPDLTFDMSILNHNAEYSVLSISWTYKNGTGMKVPYQVPLDIAGVNKTSFDKTAVLSNWVKYTAGTSGPFTLDILNPKSTAAPKPVLYTLTSDMQFGEYINIINGKAETKSGSKGIMGIFEQTSSDLFLSDGVYSLWARDSPSPP